MKKSDKGSIAELTILKTLHVEVDEPLNSIFSFQLFCFNNWIKTHE